MKTKFENISFGKRLKSMLKVDFRRLFTTNLFYIMFGVSIVIPILVLVMTTMMDGTVSVNPQTGVETVIEGFDNTWQSIATLSTENSAMSMDLTSMCNINMLYFLVSILVCMFVIKISSKHPCGIFFCSNCLNNSFFHGSGINFSLL